MLNQHPPQSFRAKAHQRRRPGTQSSKQLHPLGSGSALRSGRNDNERHSRKSAPPREGGDPANHEGPHPEPVEGRGPARTVRILPRTGEVAKGRRGTALSFIARWKDQPPSCPARRGGGTRAARSHPEAGFSLIEVMVVLVIIGLISSVIAFNVLPALDQGKDETARIQIRTLSTALTDYKFDNQTYPRTEDGLEALVAAPASLARPDRYRQGGYIRSLPLDPWGNPYQYAYPGRYAEYDIYSLGADGREGGEGPDADIGTWNVDR